MPARPLAFTDDEVQRIRDMRSRGASSDAISRVMHASRDRVDRVLSGDLSVEENHKKEVDRLVSLVAEGKGMNEIIAITGISYARINRLLRERGIDRKAVMRNMAGANLIKQQTTIPPLTDDDWRYLAGVFDIAGQVLLESRKTKKPEYYIMISGRSAAIDRIVDLMQVGRTRHGKSSSIYTVRAHVDIVAFCEGILPHTAIPNIVSQVIERNKPGGGNRG